jgi:hypothetical protein
LLSVGRKKTDFGKRLPRKKFPLQEISIGHMIKVITVMLDLGRMHYVDGRKKEKRHLKTRVSFWMRSNLMHTTAANKRKPPRVPVVA